MMGFWAGVPVSDIATAGSYRLTFRNTGNLGEVPNLFFPLEFNINDKRVRINAATFSKDFKTFTVQVDVLQNPLPVALIAEGILILLGIAGALLVLDKVEKMVTSPGINILLYAGIALAAFFIYKKYK